MTDYIERHEAIVAASRPILSRAQLRRFICQIPAADVVEVVRCKDCVYFAKAKVNKKGFLICPASGMDITEEDYCSYGERKEGEE